MAERLPGENPELHERSDIRIGPVVRAGIVSMAVLVVIHIALYWTFQLYRRAEEAKDPLRIRSGVAGERPLPPEPRLQGMPGLHPRTPREDLEEMRKRDQELLQSYGLTGEEGVARIPIERAMEILLERGLPAREAPAGSGR